MKYFFPRDLEQNNKLRMLKDVWGKYTLYKEQGVISTFHSMYPRLSTSRLRGKKASVELLNHMFKNISDVPLVWVEPNFIFVLENIKEIHTYEDFYYLNLGAWSIEEFLYLTQKDGITHIETILGEHKQRRDEIKKVKNLLVGMNLTDHEKVEIIHLLNWN